MDLDVLIVPLRWLHITLGFVGLAAFWVPVVSKKGGRRHRSFGKIFAACGYVVAGTAMLTPPIRLGGALASGATFAENAASFGLLMFLFYLGTVTLAMIRFAVQTIRTRKEPDRIRTRLNRVIAVLPAVGSVVVVGWAIFFRSQVSIVLLGLSPAGVLVTRDWYRYMVRRPSDRRAWFYAHMKAMLGAGVAFHTAFLVFGSRAVFDLSVLGPLNWLPWVLPALIGIPAQHIWENHYRRRDGGGSVPAAPHGLA